MSYWEADVGAGLVLTWNKCAKTPSLNKCDQKHKEESRYQSGNRYLRERGIWHFCLAGWSKWWKEGTTLSCSLCFALKPQFFKTYLMSRRKKNVFWFGQTLMHFLHCLCKSVNLPYVKKTMQICSVWRSAQWGLLNTAKCIVVHLLGMLGTALYRGKKWTATKLVRILTKWVEVIRNNSLCAQLPGW